MKFYLTCLAGILMTFSSFRKQAALSVSSPAFSANGMMPGKYSCNGAGVSPPVTISNAPQGTKSLALIIHDPDAQKPGGMVHWVLYNLPVDGNIPEGFKGAVQGMNGGKTTGYKPACPPSGTHHYNFYAYALDSMLPNDSTLDKAALEKVMQGHILAQGKLTGLYGKPAN